MILSAQNISFAYGDNKVLFGINIAFEKGKMYAIRGASGSGKTTLLSLLSGIDHLQEGTVSYHQKPLNQRGLGRYRKQIAIVFQAYNLISYMSALQNVETALEIVGRHGNKRQRAIDSLRAVGIDDKDMRRPTALLSGGQQQRVAIARALAKESDVIFADEPTGNLDKRTSQAIVDLLARLAHQENKCVICVTHDSTLAAKADQVFQIEDGRISDTQV